jgi:ribonuclease Z
MKKPLIIIVPLLAVLLLAYSQRSAIVLRILPRAVATAMSNNPLKELGAGLHITLCGAGGPLPDPKRSGACAIPRAISPPCFSRTSTLII